MNSSNSRQKEVRIQDFAVSRKLEKELERGALEEHVPNF